MTKHLRILSVLALAMFLAGCQGPCDKITSITAPALTGGSANFSTYVAVGTSISAGWQSGGLVDRHQVHAFPVLFARQTGHGATVGGAGQFTFPAVDQDGIPALLEIQSFSPLVISNAGRTVGAPENFSQATAYHNLGVPGMVAFDFGDESNYYSTNAPLYRTNFTMFNLIARHQGTIAAQALSLQPTFMSFELGANEVLGSATNGVDTQIFPPASYAAILTGAMNAIHTALPNTKIAIFNVPDVTTIPFCTTFSPLTIDLATQTPVSLIGPDGALAAKDLVLLTADSLLYAGDGFPVGSYNYLGGASGNGNPLPNAVVLSTAEQTTISGAIALMNTAIDSVANRPWVAKADLNGLLAQVATSGIEIGNTTYTSAYVTGGVFSLDGVHPNDLADALLCNLMIDAVNAKFGSTVPHVHPADYATPSASAARPARDAEGRLQIAGLHGLRAGLRVLFPWRH